MITFKSLGESLFKFNNAEAIRQQLAGLTKRE